MFFMVICNIKFHEILRKELYCKQTFLTMSVVTLEKFDKWICPSIVVII